MEIEQYFECTKWLNYFDALHEINKFLQTQVIQVEIENLDDWIVIKIIKSCQENFLYKKTWSLDGFTLILLSIYGRIIPFQIITVGHTIVIVTGLLHWTFPSVFLLHFTQKKEEAKTLAECHAPYSELETEPLSDRRGPVFYHCSGLSPLNALLLTLEKQVWNPTSTCPPRPLPPQQKNGQNQIIGM